MARLPIIIACLMATVLSAPSRVEAEQWNLTLDQALARAIEENRDIRVVRERLAELEGIKGEAMSMGLPQITGTGEYQRAWRLPQINLNGMTFKMGTENTYTAGASVSQLLFDGGRVFKAVRAAKSEQARGLANIRDAEEQIRLSVKQTWYEVLYTDRVIEVFEKELKQLKSHLGAMRTRFSEGIDSDYTVMRQEVAVSNIMPQIIDARRMRELLINGMKILLAIPPGEELKLAGPFEYRARSLPSVEELSERAREKRPDLAAEKLRKKTLEHNVGIEKSAYWPNLAFNSSFQWQGQTNDWKPGPTERTDALQSAVTLTWPIFEGFKTHSRVKQARAKFMQQSYQTSQMEDAVVKDVRDAHETLMRSREALASQRKSLATAQKATGIAGQRFEAGLMSQIELNDTITAEAQARQNHLRAELDCLIAEAALDRAAGGEL